MKNHVFLFMVLIVALFLVLACASCGDDDNDDNNDNDDIDDDDDDDNNDDNNDDDDTSDDDDNDDDTTDTVEVFQDGDDLVLRNAVVTLRYHLTPGRFSISDSSAFVVIENAEAAVWSSVVLPRHRWHTSELPFVEWSDEAAENPLGAGRSILVTRGGGDAPIVHQIFTLLEGETPLLMNVQVENGTGGSIKVGAIYPLLAEDAGALHFGKERDIRVLTNGILNYLEFIAPIVIGTTPALSNWNILVHNQETGASLALGALSFDVAQPVFYYGPGRSKGQQVLHVDCEYDPPKAIAAGDVLDTETTMLDFAQPTPQDALENYADRIKAWLNIETWLDRHPDIGIPIGWNSWSGSGSSGGYGTGIDEQIIVDNMDFADRELRRWGMNYFQLDDGWEPAVGDWEVNTARFPDHGDQNGIEWLLARANQMGFQTGIWMAAFNAAHHSQIVANHPELWGDPLGGGLIEWGERYLDLSKPVAQEHLAGLMEMLLDWGVQWVKLDFAYFAVSTTHWYDSTLTRGEFYRTGCRIMRETLGDDVFFLNVAVVGWNIDLVDSVRLTLDTMPVWEGEKPADPITNQGLKPMYRDATRKYYFHNRVFVNHPDLTFFRAHQDTNFPPLTLNESETFNSSVALLGGLIKIGDRIVDLRPEWVDSLRKIMPVHKGFSRPLDLMKRKYPEVWSVPLADFDQPYHVIGLLNWGLNSDLTTSPFSRIPDTAREISAQLADAGLSPTATYHAFEFWTQEYLGEVTGELAVTVPARTPRVVALHEVLDRPQFLGTNRHVLGGVDVIHSLAWNDTAQTLSATMEGSMGTVYAPFTHHLTFHLPAGYEIDNLEFDTPAGFEIMDETVDVDGDIATVSFVVVETSDDPAQWHPEIGWTLSF
ncbi:MAG: alpha-galactosidase [Candidatus Lernaella stagnicola]|nr:alpha-galactosidase [Candidatus Lernaella stagnicola]